MLELQNLKDFICFNQKKIVSFDFDIANNHKKFKELFSNNSSDEEIQNAYENLIIEAYSLLLEIFKNNVQYVKKIFNQNIEIKIQIIEENNLITIFDSKNPDDLFYQIKLSEDKSIQNIIQNNLPCSEKDNALIIPMSISKDNNDSKEFLKRFFNDKEKSYFGFITIENTNSNSKELAIIISDILSLYLMSFYNYITSSDTIKEYEKKILNQENNDYSHNNTPEVMN